jgi:chromate transporter
MAGVTIQLAQHALTDALTVAITIASAVLLVRWRINATWLILAGGVIGLVRMLLFQ